jgi:hypothetical protein
MSTCVDVDARAWLVNIQHNRTARAGTFSHRAPGHVEHPGLFEISCLAEASQDYSLMCFSGRASTQFFSPLHGACMTITAPSKVVLLVTLVNIKNVDYMNVPELRNALRSIRQDSSNGKLNNLAMYAEASTLVLRPGYSLCVRNFLVGSRFLSPIRTVGPLTTICFYAPSAGIAGVSSFYTYDTLASTALARRCEHYNCYGDEHAEDAHVYAALCRMIIALRGRAEG